MHALPIPRKNVSWTLQRFHGPSPWTSGSPTTNSKFGPKWKWSHFLCFCTVECTLATSACVPANHRDRCKRSMFVARDDHEEAEIIKCPLPDCDNVWCKQCQRTVDIGGPQHSCDGTLELDRLMKQQGWKYCPCMSVLAYCRKSPTLFALACKTPIQKVSGCNHMSVSSTVIWRLSAEPLLNLLSHSVCPLHATRKR